MEPTNDSRNADFKSKLEDCFGNLLLRYEEKFPNDYEVLRGLSNDYTDMYHELYDQILPSVNTPGLSAENSTMNHSTGVGNDSHVLQTQKSTKVDNRSKTPLKMPPSKVKKDDEVKFEKNEKNIIKINKTAVHSPNKKDTTPNSPKNKERPKTPIKGGVDTKDNNNTKSVRDLKKDTDNAGGNKSTNNLPTVKRSIAKNDTKQPPVKKVEKDNTKTIKRDLTPTPMLKKNKALDTSADDVKSHKKDADANAFTGNKFNKKEEVKGKRGTATNLHIKGGVEAVASKNKRNTADNKKITIDNIKINSHNSKDKLQDNLEADKIENAIENNEDTGIKDKIDLAEIIRNAIQNKIKQKKYEFSSNKIESLYIVSNSRILPQDLRFKIITSIKEIYQKDGLKILAKEKASEIKDKIKKLNESLEGNSLKDTLNESFINKQFTPSKTAQNGLNFVTKEEENNLCKKEQSEEILNIFRLVYVLINEPYDQLNPQMLIQNLTTGIFDKLGIENLKSLFLNYISKHTDISDYQYEQITSIVNNNPKLLSSSDLLKVNRSVSYMTFILKELYEFLTMKTSDGNPVYRLKNLNNQLNELNRKLGEVNKLID